MSVASIISRLTKAGHKVEGAVKDAAVISRMDGVFANVGRADFKATEQDLRALARFQATLVDTLKAGGNSQAAALTSLRRAGFDELAERYGARTPEYDIAAKNFERTLGEAFKLAKADVAAPAPQPSVFRSGRTGQSIDPPGARPSAAPSAAPAQPPAAPPPRAAGAAPGAAPSAPPAQAPAAPPAAAAQQGDSFANTQEALIRAQREATRIEQANATIKAQIDGIADTRNGLKAVADRLSPSASAADKQKAFEDFQRFYAGSGYRVAPGSPDEQALIRSLGNDHPRSPEKIAQLLSDRPFPIPPGVHDESLPVQARIDALWQLDAKHKFTQAEAEQYIKHLKGDWLQTEVHELGRALVDFPHDPAKRADAIGDYLKSAEFNKDIARLQAISRDGDYQAFVRGGAAAQPAAAQRDIGAIVADIRQGARLSPEDVRGFANGYGSYLSGEQKALQARHITEHLTSLYDASNGMFRSLKKEGKDEIRGHFEKLRAIMDSDDYKLYTKPLRDADPDVGRQTRKSIDKILDDLREGTPISSTEVRRTRDFFMRWHNEDNPSGIIPRMWNAATGARLTQRHGAPSVGAVAGTVVIAGGVTAAGLALRDGVSGSGGAVSGAGAAVSGQAQSMTAIPRAVEAMVDNAATQEAAAYKGVLTNINKQLGGGQAYFSDQELDKLSGVITERMRGKLQPDGKLTHAEAIDALAEGVRAGKVDGVDVADVDKRAAELKRLYGAKVEAPALSMGSP